jgi:hypothetical protein
MKFAVLLISDGRDEYRERTVASAKEMLPEPDYFLHVDDREHELGFAGAIRAGWRRVLTETDADYVFHLEQDFTFNRPVPIEEMGAVLRARPHLAQLALRRQPWNDHERAAGGVVEMHPDDYAEHELNGWRWLEHTRNFTTNPSLYRRGICEFGWPAGTDSEGHFGIAFRESYPGMRFGYWGARDSGEAVTHIGDVRAGKEY